jgi:ABC-2 type transport system ATP-binding protein
MPIVSISHLRKEVAIFRHQRGALAAVRSLLTRERRVVKAVADVSFSIGCGELVGYLGPNGSAKSTAIKILTGILVPASSDVSVNGRVPWRERQTYVARIGAVR